MRHDSAPKVKRLAVVSESKMARARRGEGGRERRRNRRRTLSLGGAKHQLAAPKMAGQRTAAAMIERHQDHQCCLLPHKEGQPQEAAAVAAGWFGEAMKGVCGAPGHCKTEAMRARASPGEIRADRIAARMYLIGRSRRIGRARERGNEDSSAVVSSPTGDQLLRSRRKR